MSSISTNRFNYFKERKQFVGEVSSLEGFAPGRIFPDSSDIGFTLVSEKTGKGIIFVHNNTHYKHDELISWEFKAHTDDPELKEMTVIIFND